MIKVYTIVIIRFSSHLCSVVPVNGQLSRTSPPPGSVVCPGARVEYTCQTGESGGVSILTWSIDGVDLAPFIGSLSMLTPGSTRNFSGGVATLTEVSSTGLMSTFVIDSAGEGTTNQAVIACGGIGLMDVNVTLNIVCKCCNMTFVIILYI